jgi:hypothetical protein
MWMMRSEKCYRSEHYVSSTRIHEEIPVLGTDRIIIFVDWVLEKGPLERGGELDGPTVAGCLVDGAFCF